ncbi:MAG: hypothetical protein LUG91_00065 [Ruminococcus sp.]|nr:hypothetical protein [Ruminococcus sp.]
MAYCVNYGELYENESVKELKVGRASEIRVQAYGSGQFQLIGKLTADSDPKVLGLVRLSDFECVQTVTDGEIYAADVQGFYSVSVQDVSGVTSVYVSLWGEN